MPKAILTIRGMVPVPWGSNEWEWRSVLAEEGRSVSSRLGVAPAASDTRFRAKVVFYMNSTTIERADLDNLAKPVLDTLFRSRHPQVRDMSLTGALFEVDDDRVFELSLEKRVAAEEASAGADVEIEWD